MNLLPRLTGPTLAVTASPWTVPATFDATQRFRARTSPSHDFIAPALWIGVGLIQAALIYALGIASDIERILSAGG